jgi:DNA-binding response OmpR family regulator
VAKKKILVIDDDGNLVTFLKTLLEDHDYESVEASDGQEGLNKLESEKPDLVLLDITMPEKSGVRFYRDVREGHANYKDIPIIMVTGVMEEFKQFISTRRQVPPPDGYISKPVDKEVLLAKIAELLAR